MPKQLLTFFFIIFTVALQAQTNLVINPSFEDTVHCPDSDDEMNYSIGWNSYAASPDYFNACSSPQTGGVAIPYNFAGYQVAASGKAYAGFITYVSHTLYSPNYREYIGEMLSSPLTIGTKYYISFKVSMTISSLGPSNCATDKIGAMLSTISYDALAFNPAPITNNPIIHSNTIVTDTLNWTRITGSFIADSAYKYIAIGNFFDDSNTDTLVMDGSNICQGAYYYLDDICVSTDSIFSTNYSYTGISTYTKSSSFKIFPNPANNEINVNADKTFAYYYLISVLGEIKKQGRFNSNVKIEVGDLNEGMYILQLDETYFYKILISR